MSKSSISYVVGAAAASVVAVIWPDNVALGLTIFWLVTPFGLFLSERLWPTD